MCVCVCVCVCVCMCVCVCARARAFARLKKKVIGLLQVKQFDLVPVYFIIKHCNEISVSLNHFIGVYDFQKLDLQLHEALNKINIHT